MAESHADLWKRLTFEDPTEKRWKAFQHRWKALRKRFDITKEEAVAKAAQEFPPLKAGQSPIPQLQPLPPDEDDDEPAPKPEPAAKRPPGRPPKEKPPEQPAAEPRKPMSLNLTLADYDRLEGQQSSPVDVVVWVNNALPFYLSFETEKRETELAALLRRAPTAGAISMLRSAAANPNKFFFDVYAKTIKLYKMDEDDAARRDDNRPVFALMEQFKEDLERAS